MPCNLATWCRAPRLVCSQVGMESRVPNGMNPWWSRVGIEGSRRGEPMVVSGVNPWWFRVGIEDSQWDEPMVVSGWNRGFPKG
eukprot:scaffold776_cov347-Pavlova_lutheri.AAC.5